MSNKNSLKNKKPLKNKTSPDRVDANTSRQTSKRRSSGDKSFLLTYRLPLFIISLLAFSLYVQSVRFEYVLDDSILIVDNKFTQQGVKGIGDIFRFESFRGSLGDQKELVEGGRYRPLSIASFALEKSITGGNPAISHAINVLLYMLSGILLFRVLLFMFPGSSSEPSDKKVLFTVPFVAAMLFIAHPLHVEVVANIKGRDEIFALLGEAGVLYFTFNYLENKKTKYLYYSFLCFFAGILSKEGLITFLAVVPLTAHFFSNAERKDKIKITIPLLIGTVLYLLMRFNAIGYFLNSGVEVSNIMNNPFYGMTFSERTATVFFTLLLYLKLLIYPHPLTHDYYPYHIPVMHWTDWQSILSLLLYAVLFILIVRGWKRKTAWSYSIAFYLITLSIVSNLFISVGTFMNERFLYHASLGFCIAASWLLVEKMKLSSSLKKAGVAIFILTIIGFSVKTLARLPDWKSIASLDRAGIKYSPNSARANYFYGLSIWNDVYIKLPTDTDPLRRKAVLDSINPYFLEALRILPNYKTANARWAGLAAEYHKLDRNNEALLKIFETVNLTGTYEVFILEYLKYMNRTVTNADDAKQLAEFYGRMIAFYDKVYKNTNLP